MTSSTTPYRRFSQQRQSAKARGIGWELTFEQWMAIWDASGQYQNRGRKVGQYVMARNGDAGPYRVGNVSICQTTENLKDSHVNKPSSARRSPGTIGRGKGWTFVKANHLKPYQVMCGGRYVGSFATQVEAESAYQAAAGQGDLS